MRQIGWFLEDNQQIKNSRVAEEASRVCAQVVEDITTKTKSKFKDMVVSETACQKLEEEEMKGKAERG